MNHNVPVIKAIPYSIDHTLGNRFWILWLRHCNSRCEAPIAPRARMCTFLLPLQVMTSLRHAEFALSFVEGQLRLKIESPTYPTYVAHMSIIYGGYIPTTCALQRGGFETNPCNWSKLGPTALDDIVDNAGEMLREMFVA
jgi:hypothetical protein